MTWPAETMLVTPPQDWLLILEVLAHWAGPDPASPRQRRAWELIELIAADQGLDPAALLRQIDVEWTGPPP